MALFDCKKVADEYFSWVNSERQKLPFQPCLAAITKGSDPGCIKYKTLIENDALKLGIKVKSIAVKSESDLFSWIEKLNTDNETHGILIMYPLYCSTADEDIMDLVSPAKDAEGLHSMHYGYLVKYKIYFDEGKSVKCIVPATPKAVVKTLQHHKILIKGSFATIINNSMRVGKALGLMLENLGATIVKCHEETKKQDLEDSINRADILVSAVPGVNFKINPDLVKQNAAVIDLSSEGNIDYLTLEKKVSFYTNKIGKVTRAMTFVNLLYCIKLQNFLKTKQEVTENLKHSILKTC